MKNKINIMKKTIYLIYIGLVICWFAFAEFVNNLFKRRKDEYLDTYIEEHCKN